MNVADVIRLLGYLFVGEASLDCEESADSNSDGVMNIADAIYTFEHLFFEGPPPAAPFPACGEDTGGPLGCEIGASCP